MSGSTITNTRGFTLVEILVVMLIIGLGIGIVSYGVGGDQPQVLRNEVHALANQIDIAASEATLSGETWGLQFYRDHDAERGEQFIAWRWLHFRELPLTIGGDKKKSRDDDDEEKAARERLGWQIEAPPDSEAEGRFASNVEAVLEIEGREVAIEFLSDEEIAARKKSDKSRGDKRKRGKDDDEEDGPRPDIWLAPGGDMTPFALQVKYAGTEHGPILRGDALGRVEVEVQDATE